MSRKKRFGISINQAIADKLDGLAKDLKVDRSKIVEKALSEFLEEHSHGISEHRCCGIMVAEAANCRSVDEVVEVYRDVIVSYMHSHVEKRCVCTMVVMGDSQKIRAMHRDLMFSSYRTRYIPIAHEHTQ